METERAEQFVEVSVDPIMHSDNIAALHHARSMVEASPFLRASSPMQTWPLDGWCL
ncbi:hypothetical protein [Phyllobacterium sp. 22552]|uniref:hypothetical protein n=1 Tax=Phyllobacterium sp. 22552 TaxID=3453941 RepID=UPI003F85621C